MISSNILRTRKDVRYTSAVDPTTTDGLAIGELWQNVVSGEIFTAIEGEPGTLGWRGTQGTYVPGSLPITSPTHPNLIAMYTMDNISGATLVDESPNGNDGTITGAITGPGVIGDGLEHDGINDFTALGASGVMDFIHTSLVFSISVWLRFNANISTNQGQTIISTAATSGDSGFLFNREHEIPWVPLPGRENQSYAFGMQIYRGSTNSPSRFPLWANVVPNTEVGEYHHYVMVGNNTVMQLYKDGVLQTKTLEMTQQNPSGSGSGRSANIGRYNHSTPGGYVNTDYDELRIFDKAVNQTEVTALFDEGTP